MGVWMTKDEPPEEMREENDIRALLEARGKEFRVFQDDKYFVDEYVCRSALYDYAANNVQPKCSSFQHTGASEYIYVISSKA